MINRKTKLLVLLIGVGIIYYFSSQPTKQGPDEVVLGKQTCVHCGMHIDDIRFAGQIQHDTGKTFFFDDLGELILYKEKITSPIKAVYYHHYFLEDTWIPEEKAAFIEVDESPMGYNFAAVFNTNSYQDTPIFSLKEVTEKVSLMSKQKIGN